MNGPPVDRILTLKAAHDLIQESRGLMSLLQLDVNQHMFDHHHMAGESHMVEQIIDLQVSLRAMLWEVLEPFEEIFWTDLIS